MPDIRTSDDARGLLRAAGMRVTASRIAVLEVLGEHPHATADAVAKLVGRRLGSVSKQAVYDVLAACTTAGLVRRIEPAGSAARFETRTGDNHHHLVCRRCGRTQDVDCTVGARPCLAPGDDAGFAVDEAEVVFWGLCPDCQVPNQDPNQHPNRGSGAPTGLPAPAHHHDTKEQP
jgi:Fur family ferric uptake transcriptional regulator